MLPISDFFRWSLICFICSGELDSVALWLEIFNTLDVLSFCHNPDRLSHETFDIFSSNRDDTLGFET